MTAYPNPTTAAAVHWARHAPLEDIKAAKELAERLRGWAYAPMTWAELVANPARCAALYAMHRRLCREAAGAKEATR